MIKKLTKRKLMLESAEGLDSFINQVMSRYPELEKFKDDIIDVINKSGCKNIEIRQLKGVLGFALHDRLVISSACFNYDKFFFLFVLFHELAHQYQFKKYGMDKMYEIYSEDISVNEGVDFLIQQESVADEFADRKVRELVRKNKTKNKIEFAPSHSRKNYSRGAFHGQIIQMRNYIKSQGITDKVNIGEILYNFIKQNFYV
jgi:hypothetical protein